MAGDGYDPKSALKAMKAGRLTNKKEDPKAYDISPRPQSLCVPLAAFMENAEAVPEDMRLLPKTGAAIRGHERPDGGVFLGLFELPDQPGSGIMLFGDPLMDIAVAKRTTIEFRRRLQRILDDAAEQEQQGEVARAVFGGTERTLKLES